MILATTQIEDLDRFVEVFSTTGAEKRELHGSKGAIVFRDPNETDRVWALFESPTDMARTIAGCTGKIGLVTPAPSLVSGDDFLTDGATAVNAPLAAGLG